MSQLTTNTATIDELITMATNLPDAGSGGEDVSAETTEYTSLLTDLEAAVDALPDAGSGGGGTVETCSVRISTQGTGNVGYILYVGINENGQKELLLHGEDSFEAPFDTTINNVVRGTFVIFGTVILNYDSIVCNCTGAEYAAYSDNEDLHVIWIHDEAEATIEIAEYSE